MIHEWNYNLQNEMLSTIKEWQDLAKKLEQENSEFKQRISELELKFTALGNLAIANWDASTLEEVDDVVDPNKTTYNDHLRTLFNTNPDKIKKLERENAALRADKERLDWLSTENGCIWAHHESEQCNITRRAIDAAMKEAQP